jgi:hypothetical protein
MKAAMATPSSGPAAASKTGSKNRDEPRPATPGGGIVFKTARTFRIALASDQRRFGMKHAAF